MHVLLGFGSPSDYEKMKMDFPRADGTRHFLSVTSAHRLSARVRDHALAAPFDATIAAAGMKNGLSDAFYLHCPGAVHVALPIYDSKTGGLSSVLSSCEMPPGCPVAMSAVGDLRAAVGFVNYALGKPYAAVRVHGDGGFGKLQKDSREA